MPPPSPAPALGALFTKLVVLFTSYRETGSLTGLAWNTDTPSGHKFTLGAFFEGGWGNYSSYNDFSNAANVNGDGNTSYFGGGLLGRFAFNQGFYVEASPRLGRAETDFDSSDIKFATGTANYETSGLYYSAHAGAGWKLGISQNFNLDFSARLLWTRQEGDSVNMHGDTVDFDDADSLRSRLGGRAGYAFNEYVSGYAGAYWEHEFKGEADGSVNGVSINDAPELKGSSAVDELGINLRPQAGSPFSVDLGVQGYAGTRDGVSGSLQVKYEF